MASRGRALGDRGRARRDDRCTGRRSFEGGVRVTCVLLGSQVIGALGAARELAYGADDTAKARHLHDLGVDYRLALAGNLAFSILASTVFAWAVVQLIRGRRREP